MCIVLYITQKCVFDRKLKLELVTSELTLFNLYPLSHKAMNNTFLFVTLFLGIHHFVPSIIIAKKKNLFPELFVPLTVDSGIFLATTTCCVSSNLKVKEAERLGERKRAAALLTILTGLRQFPHIYC